MVFLKIVSNFLRYIKIYSDLKFFKIFDEFLQSDCCNRPFSYSRKVFGSNDISLCFVEFSNAHNTDRSSIATQSNFVYKNV